MSTEVGMNRTGTKLSPRQTEEMETFAQECPPSSEGDAQLIAQVRLSYSQEGEPIGKVPPPTSVKGAVKSLLGALGGENVAVLIDRMGQRLAFERTGVRLYDALLSKWDAFGSFEGGPERMELERHRDEELAHLHLMHDALEQLGGDPTAVTPSADVAAIVASGIPMVLTDPRTTLIECLDAVLVAELADNAGWDLLEQLARGLGQDELADTFADALSVEERHAEHVRDWLLAGVSSKAGAKPAKKARRRPEEKPAKARRRPAAKPAKARKAKVAKRTTAKATPARTKKATAKKTTPTRKKATARRQETGRGKSSKRTSSRRR